ncbi:MAG: glycosyltransferase family 2 protein [Nitrococcus mobilis]|nr:glycosyltransferase family 2 protein [Nitrococcus mobilis]
MTMEPKVATVVVTHNRCELLKKCLLAISRQIWLPDRLLVIDNASTDGTTEWLHRWLPQHMPRAELMTLPQNLGGAGGFATGLRIAVEQDTDWVWMMDDDAEPEPNALEALLNVVDSNDAIYGSIAITEDGRMCWPFFSVDGESYANIQEVPDRFEVAALPFLGILIPRSIVEVIGYPNADYFIAGDDVEFCFRARKYGFHILASGKSRLQHPPSDYYRFGVGQWAPICFRIAPWKRYYDVRNRILTSWQYGPFHIWTRTLPASILRLLATLINEPERIAQLRAYIAGIFDGTRQVNGIRHKKWGL